MTWQPIPGYEGLYEVSDDGAIRRIPGTPAYPAGNRQLKPWLGSTGYLHVTLYKGGRPAEFRVHRLVALAFLGPANGLHACHGDGNRLNNARANIRWGTRSENMLDAVKHGTHAAPLRGRTHCKNGHEFTEANTLVKPDGRKCRTCRRDRVTAWRNRRKAAQA
jgi:hypothetical protein